jgi:hypothetical protein
MTANLALGLHNQQEIAANSINDGQARNRVRPLPRRDAKLPYALRWFISVLQIGQVSHIPEVTPILCLLKSSVHVYATCFAHATLRSQYPSDFVSSTFPVSSLKLA